MPLTPAQLATFKTAILANTGTIPAGFPWSGGFVGTAVNAVPNTSDGNAAVAGWYSQLASPTYLAWHTAVSIKTVRAAADLGKYTPTDAAPASPSTDMTYQNRALLCQLKQANAMFLLQGTDAIDCTGSALRLTFNDCMTGVPSGASGANQNAGWGTAATPGAVRLAMQRAVTNLEKVFTTAGVGTGPAGNVSGDARGSATNPDALVVVGGASAADVNSALNLP